MRCEKVEFCREIAFDRRLMTHDCNCQDLQYAMLNSDKDDVFEIGV